MSIYSEVVDKIRKSLEHKIDVSNNRREGFCDFIYKGYVILKVTDCDSFCVLESPILMTKEPHGHTVILFESNPSMLKQICSYLDIGLRRLMVLFRVLKDRFDYYKSGRCFYFKVENVILVLCLEFSGWCCKVIIDENSSYSYLRVVSNLCKELCYCIGNELYLSVDVVAFENINENFINKS